MKLDATIRTKQPKIQQLKATRTQADIEWFLRIVQKVEQGIKAGIFYPNENYMYNICGYKEMCEKR